MAQVDFGERALTVKLVYYGPPRSGKTSNLRALHAAVDKLNRGRLMTLDTRDDRTLFFDLLPIFFRTSSFSFRLKVYTVPGQPVHEATRKVVLSGADGVVFVADSAPGQGAANRTAWENLQANLRAHQLAHVPVVVQLNKRDLPDAMPADGAAAFAGGAPVFEACARAGEGVMPTFFELVGRAWDGLAREVPLARQLGLDRAEFLRLFAEHVGLAR